MPTSCYGPVGQNGGHAVGVARVAHGLVRLCNADPLCEKQRLVTCAHCRDVFIGLHDDGLDLLKFNIANGSTVIRDGRYIFRCAAKFNGEGFSDQVLCYDVIVYCIDYHAGRFDERETNDCVHTDLRASCNDNVGRASIMSKVG
jgi:hypothetical protein